MENIGELIRRLREEKGEPLRKVAAFLEMDQAVLSKIERGKRKAPRKKIEKLAQYFDVDPKEIMISWLSSRIIAELEREKYADEALKAANEILSQERLREEDHGQVIKQISNFLDNDDRIKKAWIFGPFAVGSDHRDGVIDMMVEEMDYSNFSYFDLAEIQQKLERIVKRKIEIRFTSSLSSYVAENIRRDAVLIYESSDAQLSNRS